MNKRFLFRGKRIDNGEWATGGYGLIPHPPVCFKEDLKHVEPDKHCIVCENPNTLADWGMPRQMCMIEVIPETVGQCTGLIADKSYRGDSEDALLIWEDDILKDRFDNIYVVKYCDAWAAFQAQLRYGIGEDGKPAKFLSGSQSFIGNSFRKWEVIGNIHEHPELLDGGKQ